MGQRGLIECLQYIECGVYTTHGAYTPVRQRGLLNTTTYFTFLLLSYYYLLYYFTTLLLIPTLLLYYSPSHPRATRSLFVAVGWLSPTAQDQGSTERYELRSVCQRQAESKQMILASLVERACDGVRS
jgi:hypothetical protein